ncbi:MAG: response regulator transcription factor [Verrucomicrobiae bacterium]|nr:response regulator transcription factor [Verrucomicrobiae bacterium]
MRKINCVIIDDEPPATEVLKYYIERTPDFELDEIYNDPVKALDGLRSKNADVIFCDVEMPDISGLQLLESLSLNQNRNALIVIVSAHSKYAIDGFDINAIDYLLKPVSFARYLKATQKIFNHINGTNSNGAVEEGETNNAILEPSKDYLFIKSSSKLLKISFQDIVYIEAMGDYVKIFTEHVGKPYVILDSLKHLEETLPAALFKRIHRSYIVAVPRIKAIEYKRVIISEELSLPISNTYYHALYDCLVSNHIVKVINPR